MDWTATVCLQFAGTFLCFVAPWLLPLEYSSKQKVMQYSATSAIGQVPCTTTNRTLQHSRRTRLSRHYLSWKGGAWGKCLTFAWKSECGRVRIRIGLPNGTCRMVHAAICSSTHSSTDRCKCEQDMDSVDGTGLGMVRYCCLCSSYLVMGLELVCSIHGFNSHTIAACLFGGTTSCLAAPFGVL